MVVDSPPGIIRASHLCSSARVRIGIADRVWEGIERLGRGQWRFSGRVGGSYLSI
jgi:hypothetical protein